MNGASTGTFEFEWIFHRWKDDVRERAFHLVITAPGTRFHHR